VWDALPDDAAVAWADGAGRGGATAGHARGVEAAQGERGTRGQTQAQPGPGGKSPSATLGAAERGSEEPPRWAAAADAAEPSTAVEDGGGRAQAGRKQQRAGVRLFCSGLLKTQAEFCTKRRPG